MWRWDQSHARALSSPARSLQGCTPITSGNEGQRDEELSYRYEINLGQHVHGSGPVNWTLTLESLHSNEATTSSLEYKIYSLKDNDKTWMVRTCLGHPPFVDLIGPHTHTYHRTRTTLRRPSGGTEAFCPAPASTSRCR